MKLIVWGGLLAVALLADPAATEGCSFSRRAEDNLALGKRAIQSSTLSSGFGGTPAKAVDGKCNGFWMVGSCSHTELESNPWWLVDLEESQIVYTVLLKNREDCCGERLRGAEVHLGDSLEDNGRANPLCQTILAAKWGEIITVSCSEMQGRYLSVNLPRSDSLTLCEVEAYRDR